MPGAEPTTPSRPAGLGASELVAFRYASYDVPFWARPNTLPGRWHRVGDGATQYWALTPEAAWAELIRHEELGSVEELATVRMPIWVCRAPSALVLDLCTPAGQAEHGITARELVGRDWSPCQQLGRRLRERFRGVLAPSAVLDGHVNLTLFGERRMIAWERRSLLASAVPAALVAIGRPPDELLGRVRRRPGRR